MRIFIGASSNDNIPQKYFDDCYKLINEVLVDNDLVFGAYDRGLMGVSYEAAKKNNRKIIGITSEIHKDSFEILDCNEEIVTKTMLESTLKIYEKSDVILMLPGGYGCLYEFFTANYSKIAKNTDVPIILYNSCGYYNKLLSFIDDICEQNLIAQNERNNFLVANNIDDVKEYLKFLSIEK